MSRFSWLLVLAVVASACGGGGGGGSVAGPTPVTGGTPPAQTVVGPPAGASLWTFVYRPASTTTCPGAVQTPDDGGVVTITLAADGRSLTLVGVAATTIAVGTVTTDGAGNWTQAAPGLIPGSLVTITFRFSTSSHADGQIVAFNAIFTGGAPCSATWPIVLDRQ